MRMLRIRFVYRFFLEKVVFKNTRFQEPAGVVVEGIDQFRGWFQSMLLTSSAIQVISITFIFLPT